MGNCSGGCLNKFVLNRIKLSNSSNIKLLNVMDKRSKLNLLVAFAIIVISNNCFSQDIFDKARIPRDRYPDSDSCALMKMVKGIDELIRNRAKATGYPSVFDGWGSRVALIQNEGAIPIDSLYKYHIKDFKSITVQFDLNPMMYGIRPYFGIIFLQRKEK